MPDYSKMRVLNRSWSK